MARETLENPADSRENGSANQGQHWVMGGRQLGFTDYEQTTAKKRTRREKFLAEMEEVVPWQRLVELIELTTPRPARREAGLPTHWPPCCGST